MLGILTWQPSLQDVPFLMTAPVTSYWRQVKYRPSLSITWQFWNKHLTLHLYNTHNI